MLTAFKKLHQHAEQLAFATSAAAAFARSPRAYEAEAHAHATAGLEGTTAAPCSKLAAAAREFTVLCACAAVAADRLAAVTVARRCSAVLSAARPEHLYGLHSCPSRTLCKLSSQAVRAAAADAQEGMAAATDRASHQCAYSAICSMLGSALLVQTLGQRRMWTPARHADRGARHLLVVIANVSFRAS